MHVLSGPDSVSFASCDAALPVRFPDPAQEVPAPMATQLSLGLAPARVRLEAACRDMALLRCVDEATAALALRVPMGPVPAGTGLEALLSGTAVALQDRDWVLPGARHAAIALLRGASLHAWFGQALGRASDPARGRQSPGLASFRSLNVVSASTPPGSQLPVAAGVGRAMKAAGRGDIALALCGHGATATGDFHVALNFAAVSRSPVVFVVATQGDLSDATATRSVAIKGIAYGMPATEVDGGDPLAVEMVVRQALESARSGKGPQLIDATCPSPARPAPGRLHAVPDEAPDAEWARRDPLARAERQLAENGGPDAAMLATRRAEIRERVDAAIDAVLALPGPDASLLFDDVFARPTPALMAQRRDSIADRAFRELEDE
jgi:pyruvate dehydrogenase E1 component alpha subunit